MQGKLCRLSRTESVTDKKGGIGDLCTTTALQISLIKYITCSPVKSKHQFFGVRTSLGVGFKHFSFSPRTLGKWSNLTSIFFKWVGSTTNQFCTCFFFFKVFRLDYLRYYPKAITATGFELLALGIPQRPATRPGPVWSNARRFWWLESSIFRWTICYPPEVKHSPWKVTFSIGKACLPSIIFQGLC